MQEPEASLREVNLDTKHVIDRRESNAPRGVDVSAPRGCERISVNYGVPDRELRPRRLHSILKGRTVSALNREGYLSV